MNKMTYPLMAALIMAFTISCNKNNPDEIEREEVITMPEAVDIGLVIEREDGTTYKLKWANFNLGASEEWEYGYHYAWGETKRKKLYDWSNYKFSHGQYDQLTGYCTKHETDFWYSTKKAKVPDGLTQLRDTDDAAHVKLGGKWRMPTGDELEALFALTEEKYKDQYDWDLKAELQDSEGNVTYGLKITQKSTGNYVFFPAAGDFGQSQGQVGSYGYYWSSSLEEDFPSHATCLKTGTDEHFFRGVVEGNERYMGCSIRPVCEE